TFGGRAEFQVANCLAAAAASRALGCTSSQVALKLTTFVDTVDNPGRSSLYSLGNGYVMVDYGHNPAAFRSTGALVNHWSGPLIGIVGAPGDRDDAIIYEVATAAAAVYHHVLIREDADRRGRSPGEVPAMMRDTILRVNPAARVEIVTDELEALRALLPQVIEGSLVVLYYEHLEPVAAILAAAGGKPADGSSLFSQSPVPTPPVAPVPMGAK
ncbi:MAG TPA: cyanophycin synthetase, partial [Trueperaceae bacterium]|nr:cyanophycin synthetase [Trueperaceae bacterium]